MVCGATRTVWRPDPHVREAVGSIARPVRPSTVLLPRRAKAWGPIGVPLPKGNIAQLLPLHVLLGDTLIAAITYARGVKRNPHAPPIAAPEARTRVHFTCPVIVLLNLRARGLEPIGAQVREAVEAGGALRLHAPSADPGKCRIVTMRHRALQPEGTFVHTAGEAATVKPGSAKRVRAVHYGRATKQGVRKTGEITALLRVPTVRPLRGAPPPHVQYAALQIMVPATLKPHALPREENGAPLPPAEGRERWRIALLSIPPAAGEREHIAGMPFAMEAKPRLHAPATAKPPTRAVRPIRGRARMKHHAGPSVQMCGAFPKVMEPAPLSAPPLIHAPMDAPRVQNGTARLKTGAKPREEIGA